MQPEKHKIFITEMSFTSGNRLIELRMTLIINLYYYTIRLHSGLGKNTQRLTSPQEYPYKNVELLKQ